MIQNYPDKCRKSSKSRGVKYCLATDLPTVSVEPVSCSQGQALIFLFILATVGVEKLKSLLGR